MRKLDVLKEQYADWFSVFHLIDNGKINRHFREVIDQGYIWRSWVAPRKDAFWKGGPVLVGVVLVMLYVFSGYTSTKLFV